jgi:hypothetical protein
MEISTFNDVIADYKSRYLPDEESKFFEELSNFEEALLYAGLVHNKTGRRLPHMNRIRYDALARALTILNENKDHLRTAKTFHELLHGIYTMLNEPHHIQNLGPMYYYDTAYRIGAYMKLFPEHIYLHGDTTKGAVAVGIDVADRPYIDISELPFDLRSLDQKLEPRHYEDILCIYEPELREIKKQ